MRLLFLCADNTCRSPTAERLFVLRAVECLGGDLAAEVHVSSAGLDALPDLPMHKRSALTLSRLGADTADFRTRVFAPALAEESDLVLTMTRDQRTAVLTLTPRLMRRTFTLPEAADLAGRADLTGLADLPLSARAAELASRLTAARVSRRPDPSDDVADPRRRPAVVHTRVALRIDAALRPLGDALFADGPGLSQRGRTARTGTHDARPTALGRNPATKPMKRKTPKRQEAVRSPDGRP